MKIIKVKGGIGNQLFQYAFGRMLVEKYGFDVKFDLHQYNNRFNEINNYKLDLFNTRVVPATSIELKKYTKIPLLDNPHSNKYRIKVAINKMLSLREYYYEMNRLFVDIDSIIDFSYFDGYWQCEDYFTCIRDQLINELSLKHLTERTKSTICKIKEDNAVFIGVRRPYSFESNRMKKSLDDISSCSEYYVNAIKYISKRVSNPIFYAFSNDIEWVKNNIDFETEVIYIDKKLQLSDVEELIAMSSCNHAIISNSTFNWWGAWLIQNPGKIVCVPKHWQRRRTDIIPNSWIKYEKMIEDLDGKDSI